MKWNIAKYGLAISLLLLLLPACRIGEPAAEKITGLSFVAPPSRIGEEDIRSVNEVNAGWVCLMPFAYGRQGENRLYRGTERQWWGEKPEGIIDCIEMFRKHHKKIMLKPQLWIIPGTYTGDFSLAGENDWEQWEADYRDYILEYARIAMERKVELFCIGTELKTAIRERPEFWHRLIAEVKAVYHGKITYAANWDNYQNIPFWKELDYMGIDAYFPLSVKNDPTEKELMHAWKQHKDELLSFSESMGRALLFTEIGYRNIDFTAHRPWDSERKETEDDEEQRRAYSAMFKSFWEEDRFAGLFVWKWFDDRHELRQHHPFDTYSPQKKPAEAVIKDWFSSGVD